MESERIGSHFQADTMEGIGSEGSGLEGIGAEGIGAERQRQGFSIKEMSMFEKINFEIQGVTQHVQHNGQLADGQCIYVIEMGKITSKPAKKRTSEDIKRLEDLEWEGSLYLNSDGRVVVPGSLIEGAMFEAGKLSRDGQTVRNGLQSQDDWPLIYKGPKDIDSLRADPNFRFRVMVRNPTTKARVARTRPIFREWALKFSIQFHTGLLSREDIINMVETLGDRIGLSDDRKKMGGRFTVKAHD